MASSDQIAASLENLSLDSQAKTTRVAEPVMKDFYGDNGSYVYQQTYGDFYGYMPYGAYSIPSPPLPAMGHDGQRHEYYYPTPYYQPPLQASQPNIAQVEVPTSGLGDQASLSNSSLNPNAFYERGGLPNGNPSQGYQDPRFSYGGIQSPIPWLDTSMSSNGQSKDVANSGFSPYTNNLSSGRNQNLHSFPHVMDFYGDNGSYMYQQTYGYMPYGAYSVPSSPLPAMGHDGQLHAPQEYLFPSQYYQPPLQASQPNISQVKVSTFGLGDQAPLSIETNKGNLSIIANGEGYNGSGLNFKSSSLNPNASYKRGGFPAADLSLGYQVPNYDVQSTIPWLDTSTSSNGQSKLFANGSYTNNLSSDRHQKLQPFPHVTNFLNAQPSSGVAQAFRDVNNMYPSNRTYSHYGNTIRGGSGFGSYGYDAWKKGKAWYTVGNNEKSRGRDYGKENMDGLIELNKGPRIKGYKNQDGLGPATLAINDQNLPLTESNKENSDSPFPDMEQYNREDFAESYSDAKFFVIKSYSEDDVHKSIKYNVWASTCTGNKKLDAVFREAKEKPGGCPVFLLFSVNTSGQFVGIAEMVGPVDFNKTLEYWQQDKWTGCFPVKWHIVKDVPNTSLRHITLENNENKPVTNSRDTQEVNFEQGIKILNIFKNHSRKNCILDDFEFYEARQKIIQERKAKRQLLRKQVSNGEPNETVETVVIGEPRIASMAEIVKANGSVTATENFPTKSASLANGLLDIV